MEEKTVTKSEGPATSASFNMGSFMNTTTIHIIIEIVAICGMGLYFNNKVGKLETRNAELTARLLEQEETIAKHEELLEKIVARLNKEPVNSKPKTTVKKVQHTPQPVQTPDAEVHTVASPMNLLSDIMSVASGNFGPPPQSQPQPPMPSIEELDSELENELQDLKE